MAKPVKGYMTAQGQFFSTKEEADYREIKVIVHTKFPFGGARDSTIAWIENNAELIADFAHKALQYRATLNTVDQELDYAECCTNYEDGTETATTPSGERVGRRESEQIGTTVPDIQQIDQSQRAEDRAHSELIEYMEGPWMGGHVSGEDRIREETSSDLESE